MEKNVEVETVWEYDSLLSKGGLGRKVKKGEVLWITPERAKHLIALGFVNILRIRRAKK